MSTLMHTFGRGQLVRMKGFEVDDAQHIPAPFHPTKKDLTCQEWNSLHKKLEMCHQHGRDLRQEVWENVRHMTIQGRLDTYTKGWRGPPVSDMAECGLYQINENSAKCYCCGVHFRALTPDLCIWSRHRHLSPHCRHLKRARAHGHHGPERRVEVQRRFSSSDSLSVL